MYKITEMMNTFIVSLLCNTLRKTAEMGASKTNMSVVDKYKYILLERCKALDSNEGIQNYIKDFSVYCSGVKYHSTFEQLFIDVASEFCPPDLMDQMGQQQRQSVSRGIFSKTFKESADLLVKSPDILSMVANGATNAINPCKKLVSIAIDNIRTELLSRKIKNNGSDMIVDDKVSATLYQNIRAKYDKLCSVNSVLNVELDRAMEKIKEMSDTLKKLNNDNKSLKLRLREVETKSRVPTEITINSRKSYERPYGVPLNNTQQSSTQQSSTPQQLVQSSTQSSTQQSSIPQPLVQSSTQSSANKPSVINVNTVPVDIVPDDSISNITPLPNDTEKNNRNYESEDDAIDDSFSYDDFGASF